MRRHPFRAGKTENIPRPSFRWFGELLVYVQKSRFPSDHFKDQKDHLFYYDCSNSPNRFFKRLFFFLKKEGVMKKTLLIFGLFLLFATEANALSCGSGEFLYVQDEAAGCDGSDACKAEEACHKCSNGCLTCHGFRLWNTSTQWEKTWWVYGTSDSCDSCEIGYELKKSTTANYDGSSYTSIPYYSCERKSVSCPANCSSCSSSSTCTACKSGYTLKNGACVAKNSGSGDSGKTGTVISCPDDMRLSADGCCCIAG